MKYVFLSALYLLVLFLFSHYVFEPTYLYFELPWLDIPMHLLGGLGVGFFILSITRLGNIALPFSQLYGLFLVAAIAWEVYEYTRGVIIYDETSKYLDLVKDLLMGSLGVMAAYYINKKR